MIYFNQLLVKEDEHLLLYVLTNVFHQLNQVQKNQLNVGYMNLHENNSDLMHCYLINLIKPINNLQQLRLFKKIRILENFIDRFTSIATTFTNKNFK